MIKSYDIVYKYIYEKQLDYFEMADLDELVKTRYKSKIIKATDKEQAINIFNERHKNYTSIVSVRELNTQKFNDGGREL